MEVNGMPTFDYLSGKPKKMTINLNLNDSIKKALSEFEGDQRNFSLLASMIVSRLCVAGENFAKEAVPVDTGELHDSISHSVRGSKRGVVHGVIKAGTDHAAFVEFGTGIEGRKKGYPDPNVFWIYDIYEQNWKGQPSNPFMYDTARYIENNAYDIIKGYK